jgi:hypothetical protein
MTPADLTRHELERRLVCAVVVAGKNAGFAQRVVGRLFPERVERPDNRPFLMLADWFLAGTLRDHLTDARSGNYGKLTAAFVHLANWDRDLRAVTVKELEEVPGVGPKTSRFFLLWTRPDFRGAALDVHVLRFLREDLRVPAVPRSTPADPRTYARLEAAFLAEAERRGVTPADLDAEVWAAGSRSRGIQGDWWAA